MPTKVSTKEKREQMQRSGEPWPLCKHGEPMGWAASNQLLAGGSFVCAVKRREEAREYRRAHPEKARAAQRASKARNPLKYGGGNGHRRRCMRFGVRPGNYERAEVLAKSGGRCYLCDHALDVEFEVEHVIPLCLGGTDDLDNVFAACHDCNKDKHTAHPGAYLDRIMARGPVGDLAASVLLRAADLLDSGLHRSENPTPTSELLRLESAGLRVIL